MKAILALSAAALIAAAPTVFAHDASSSPKVHHKISKKLVGVYASRPSTIPPPVYPATMRGRLPTSLNGQTDSVVRAGIRSASCRNDTICLPR